MASSPPMVVDFATKAPSATQHDAHRVTSNTFIPQPRTDMPRKRSNWTRAAASYWRVIRASPKHHQAFVAIVVGQFVLQLLERLILVAIGWQAAQGRPDESALERQTIWFLLIVMWASLFAMLNGVYALLRCNAYSLIVFFVTSFLLAVRYIIDYANRSEDCSGPESSNVCLVFLVLSLIMTLASMVLSVLMYPDLRWKRYKAIGSMVQTRTLFGTYELFRALVSLDLQNSLVNLSTAAVFFSNLSIPSQVAGLSMGIVLFAVELVWDRLGAGAVRTESRPQMYGFWALSPLLPAYVSWAIIESATNNMELLGGLAAHPSLWGTALFFAVFTIVVRIFSVYFSHVLFSAFGERYKGVRKLLRDDNTALQFEKGRIRQHTGDKNRKGASNNNSNTKGKGQSQEMKKNAQAGASAIGAAVATGAAMPDRRNSQEAASNSARKADGEGVTKNPFLVGSSAAAGAAAESGQQSSSSGPSSTVPPAGAARPSVLSYPILRPPSHVSDIDLHLGPEDAYGAQSIHNSYSEKAARAAWGAVGAQAHEEAGSEEYEEGEGEEEGYYDEGEEGEGDEGEYYGDEGDYEGQNNNYGYDDGEGGDGGGPYTDYGYDDDDDGGTDLGAGSGGGARSGGIMMTPMQHQHSNQSMGSAYSQSQAQPYAPPSPSLSAYSLPSAGGSAGDRQQRVAAAARGTQSVAIPVASTAARQQPGPSYAPPADASYGVASSATPSGASFNTKAGFAGDSTAAKAVAARRYGGAKR